MEKRGIIETGRTPLEDEFKLPGPRPEKLHLDKKGSCSAEQDLEEHLTKRAADAVQGKLKEE